MKIPNGMTQTETLEIIDKVLKRFIKKFQFDIYGEADIYQEGFIIACAGLENYDGSSPLENFLATHIKNRLISFKRDNYGRLSDCCNTCKTFDPDCARCQKRKNTCDSRRKFNQPIDIASVNPEKEKAFKELFSSSERVELNELLTLINNHLPIKMRENYLKMREGVYVNKTIREEIEAEILNILETHG